MKKLTPLFLILFGCNIIPPEPSDFTIEEVTVVDGPNFRVQDSVGLLLVVKGLPSTNEWRMVWEVNGQDVFSESVAGKSGRIVSLKKFKGSQTGEYLYRGCIESKLMRVCGEQQFFLQ
ncbi:hypothetical protein [Algoriphagus sp. CAU 1675]|uniref:hypothetical protein n=1 Tax=Algoriphagus sp. CAU 1675 TaxID=3032597 RepID=UPI0023DC24EE|nr:hypothetical protein [Algoriphagus sp. CAU 1675]MDF2159030.1 hypothetical protein [Algoriphagus sp. CAU 1675]